MSFWTKFSFTSHFRHFWRHQSFVQHISVIMFLCSNFAPSRGDTYTTYSAASTCLSRSHVEMSLPTLIAVVLLVCSCVLSNIGGENFLMCLFEDMWFICPSNRQMDHGFALESAGILFCWIFSCGSFAVLLCVEQYMGWKFSDVSFSRHVVHLPKQ